MGYMSRKKRYKISFLFISICFFFYLTGNTFFTCTSTKELDSFGIFLRKLRSTLVEFDGKLSPVELDVTKNVSESIQSLRNEVIEIVELFKNRFMGQLTLNGSKASEVTTKAFTEKMTKLRLLFSSQVENSELLFSDKDWTDFVNITLTHVTKQGNVTHSIPNITDERGLRVHIWYSLCVPDLKGVCRHPLFPKAPEDRAIIKRLEIQRNQSYFIQQVFGYIHPPVSGLYTFAVSSDDNSEVWLSEDATKKRAKKICYVGTREEFQWSSRGEFDKFSSQKSVPIYLEKNKKYYIEVIHMQIGRGDLLQVAWLPPGDMEYSVVDFRSTSVINEALERNSSGNRRVVYGSTVCESVEHQHLAPNYLSDQKRPIYIDHADLNNTLPYCTYRPNYLPTAGEMSQFDFIMKYHVNTFSYPWVVHPWVSSMPLYKESPLPFSDAREIVDEYMDHVNKSYSGVYKLNNIIKVEKKSNQPDGARYFIELNVTKTDNQSSVIAEYIYKLNTSSSGKLCYPRHLQWDKQATIAIIISVRNQGAWMGHFLDNLEEIYTSTKDQNVQLVVFDYESTDMDIDAELKDRWLPPYTVIKQPGLYSRCKSINSAIETIRDPDTIIFTLDLHLEIPNSIFDDVRKHCFKGRSVYTPVIMRLRCGHTPLNPAGFWEQQGFGLIAMYKSDWDRIGGLDEETFKETWGGEDWDLMDRVVGGALEYERVRHFKMFHFQHSRKGMWTGDKDMKRELST